MNSENAYKKLTELFKIHNEWLLIHQTGKSFALQNNEIELSEKADRVLISFLSNEGFKTWRIAEFEQNKNEILLNLTRNFGKEVEKIRFVPRISANELGEDVELARLEKANELGNLLASETEKTKLVRVSLNKENGRFANIIFERDKKQIAVLADVSDTIVAEVYISTAIIWLRKLQKRQKNPIDEIWILAEKKQAKNLQKLHALLSENRKNQIKIYEIAPSHLKKQKIKYLKNLEIRDLFAGKTPELKLAENTNLSQTAREIIEFAPDKIDYIFTKNGETLRFLGLPFARVRKLLDKEKSWFGIEREKRILANENWEEFEKLIADLKLYRRFDSSYKRHALFRLAPEAWLESVLRRNVKLLDANLILSPIYNQFRAANDKIDLLALRKDGRLIIIELKVAPDREMIFQAADYWRKIEQQRRCGNLQRAKIFGDLEISDHPTIIYLVAPTLSFHWDFDFLSKTISPELEIYRFNLAENWRENLKVLKREKL